MRVEIFRVLQTCLLLGLFCITMSGANNNQIDNLCDSKLSETICENVPDYPRDKIMQLLSQRPEEYKRLLMSDVDMKFTRSKRQVSSLDEGPCETLRKYTRPVVAKSTNGTWKYIVNNIDNFPPQQIETILCADEGTSCKYTCMKNPTKCSQKFAQKLLISFDGEEITQDVFWMPSACICKILIQ